MVERLFSGHWAMRALFVVLCGCVMFVQILPVSHWPPKVAGPDILVAMTFAWAVRRPDYVPLLLVALVALFADLLLQRPPSLWAALMVVGTETLRRRSPALRDLSFVAEWISVAGTIIFITVANRLILAVMMVDQAPLGLTVMQLLATLLAYPLVAFVSHAIFGVRKRRVRDMDGGRQGT